MRVVEVLVIVLVGLVTVITAQNSSSLDPDYVAWKAKYKPAENLKTTQSQNDTQAEKNFKDNAARVAKHNKNKNATYVQELNANADMTAKQIKKTRKGLIPDPVKKTSDASLSAVANSFANKIAQSAAATKAPSKNLQASQTSLNLTS